MRIEKHPILEFERGQRVRFTFDGQEMWGYTGETVAATLVAAGVTTFRESIKYHRERGFFCGIGRCCSCSMVIDGVPNVRSCVTYVAEGMEVCTQHGKGEISNES